MDETNKQNTQTKKRSCYERLINSTKISFWDQRELKSPLFLGFQQQKTPFIGLQLQINFKLIKTRDSNQVLIEISLLYYFYFWFLIIMMLINCQFGTKILFLEQKLANFE